MALSLHLSPSALDITPDNGVGQVIHAIASRLPALGVELVDDPARADVTACHIESQGRQVDVLHCHGLYWDDMPHAAYQPWHLEANRRIIATARAARAITVPSAWVGEPFRRDMRISPEVIGHGVALADWAPILVEQRRGYVLWNKNRGGDVCDPRPAAAMARRGLPVISTFAPEGVEPFEGFYVTGAKSHAEMKRLVRYAGVYLATTCETFGVGTLEAMAAGVPVVGYRWGGTAEIVEDGVSGFLVAPGDEAALFDAAHRILGRVELQMWMGDKARQRAADFSWDAAAEKYAQLYRRVAEDKARERHRVAVVVTSYNYGRYLGGALASLDAQEEPPDEVIIVDDGSTDDSASVAYAYIAQAPNKARFRVIEQANQGVAAARNNGIAQAEAEYIVCLDADDELAPAYLRICRDALARDRALGIAYAGVGLLDEAGRLRPAWATPFDWEHQAQPGNPPPTCVPTAAMFRRAMWERAGGYRQVHAPGEDAEFYTRGLSVGFNGALVADEPMIRYRDHGQGAHRRLEYKAIDPYYPWMHDHRYPMGAPARRAPPILSYHRPAVSVIIPCGPGHARYLSACLDSLLQQRWRSWEAVIADDTGQPGAVEEALRAYPFARVVRGIDARAIIGPGAARNAAMAAARAPLFLFLDADDWLTRSDALDAMIATHLQTGYYVYTDWIKDGEIHEAPEYRQEAWLERGQHAVTALVPADWALETPFDEAMQGWEDWKFYIDLALKGYCGHRLARPFLGYRFDSGTMRNRAWDNRARLLPQLEAYVQGKTPMGCGCNTVVRRLLGGDDFGALVMGASPDLQVGEGQTLMEFTGSSNAGSARLNSRHRRNERGRPYSYEYGGGIRFLAVYNEDVDFMASLGDFRIAGGQAQAAQEAPEQFLGSTSGNDSVPAPLAPPGPAQAALEASAPVSPEEDAAPVADVAEIERAMAAATATIEQEAATRAAQAAATVNRGKAKPAAKKPGPGGRRAG